MPILIDSVDFLDEFGNSTTFYQANAGDKMRAVYNVRSSIRMTSVANPLTLDPSVNQVQSAGISWLDEGFRVNDNVLIYIHSSGGAVINTFWSTIQYVDDVLCDFGAMPDWYSITNSEFTTMYAVDAIGSYQKLERDGVDIMFNHVKNGNPGSEFSLIDAEVSQIQFTNLALLPVGGSAVGVVVGNQSGGFLLAASVLHSAPTTGGFSYWQVIVDFINPGQYDDGTWFFSSECLKIFSKMAWARFSGEPYARYESIYNYQANTGEFNEAYNAAITDSSLISGISEIDYCVPTTFDIVVDGPVANLGIGASYRSFNDVYFKNRPYGQEQIAMAIGTAPAVVGTLVSYLNEFGAGYTIEINSVVSVLTVSTINVTFTPNAAFQTFMDGVDDGDRLFKLWVKSGNINWLVFNGQLSCDPPIGGPLPMITDFGYLDHSQNVDTATGIKTGDVADTEDDVAYFGTFLLDKNQIYENFTIRFEAFNTSTEEDFTLQQISFGFAGVPISGDGRYLLNETAAVISTLPTTSLKLNAIFALDPTLDTPTQYGVKIYIPWLLNWRYWFQQSNASVDFYPTQNKNWEQYDNLTDWTLRTELSLIKDGLAYTHANTLIDREYNAELWINSLIELIDDATNNIVNVAPIGNLMRIRATHTNLLEPWDVPTTWGMITVEPFESAPRSICSSVVDFDNNTANPLTPLSGLLINIVYPFPNVAILECYFDTNLIDLSQGVKITSKIKGGRDGIIPGPKVTAPDNIQKDTSNDNLPKILAP
jgi:hypothetical protein